MTTLIAVYNSEGCQGRCDAKCYDAKHPECDCICGGKNHGAGQQKAMDNTREMVQQWVGEYEEKTGQKFIKTEVGPEVYQQSLW